MRGPPRRPADVLPFRLHGVPRRFEIFSRYLLLWQDTLAAFKRLVETDTEAP